MLWPNFVDHFKSAGHINCSEIATGKSTNPNQKPLSAKFGNSVQGRTNTVKLLLWITPYIVPKDQPLWSFLDETECHIENSIKTRTTYRNIKGCKAMFWLLSSELTQRHWYDQKIQYVIYHAIYHLKEIPTL